MGTLSEVTIGVDIGQRVDPTAIAVVEREERVEGRQSRGGEDPHRPRVRSGARDGTPGW